MCTYLGLGLYNELIAKIMNISKCILVISYDNGFILKSTMDKVVDTECFYFHNIDLQG